MYHIFFTHSSVDGHVGHFHDLVIVNSAAINIEVHVSFWIMVFSGHMPSSRKWGITSHLSEWPSSKNLQTINAGEGVEKREPSCTAGGNVNWYSHYGEQYGGSSKNKIELLNYLAKCTFLISLLFVLCSVPDTWRVSNKWRSVIIIINL